MTRVVFLDRDGTINKLVLRPNGTFTSPFNLSEFELLPYAQDSIRRLRTMGFRVVVVTNQPHYGKEMSHEEHYEIIKYLKDIGVDCYLFASRKESDYYKPNNGNIEHYFLSTNATRTGSYMIGDRWKDIVPGLNSGLRTIFIGDKYECPDEYLHMQPHTMVGSLIEATDEIIRDEMETMND